MTCDGLGLITVMGKNNNLLSSAPPHAYFTEMIVLRQRHRTRISKGWRKCFLEIRLVKTSISSKYLDHRGDEENHVIWICDKFSFYKFIVDRLTSAIYIYCVLIGLNGGSEKHVNLRPMCGKCENIVSCVCLSGGHPSHITDPRLINVPSAVSRLYYCRYFFSRNKKNLEDRHVRFSYQFYEP